MDIDLGYKRAVGGVVTQGRGDGINHYVTSYSVQYRGEDGDWSDVDGNFTANTDRNTKVENYFPTSVNARYIRIRPQTWHEWPAMRAGLLGPLACYRPALQYYY